MFRKMSFVCHYSTATYRRVRRASASSGRLGSRVNGCLAAERFDNVSSDSIGRSSGGSGSCSLAHDCLRHACLLHNEPNSVIPITTCLYCQKYSIIAHLSLFQVSKTLTASMAPRLAMMLERKGSPHLATGCIPHVLPGLLPAGSCRQVYGGRKGGQGCSHCACGVLRHSGIVGTAAETSCCASSRRAGSLQTNMGMVFFHVHSTSSTARLYATQTVRDGLTFQSMSPG